MISISKRVRYICAAVAFAQTLWPAARADANQFAAGAVIQPSDLVAFQGFGGAVAADGTTMAVGTQKAPYAVYVYAYDVNSAVWTPQAKLTSPGGSLTDRFGSSLAIQGNTMVIGAGSASVAYVYTNVNGAWIESAVLSPTGGSGTSFAGSSLNGLWINGDTIAVGAPSEPTAIGQTGSVYVFTETNGVWTQQARITPTDPLVGWFGVTIALQNDTLLVGAPLTNSAALFEPGAAFVFTRQNGVWSEQARLDPIDVVEGGLYGLCVALDGNTAVVGAQQPSEAEVFVGNNGTWALQQIVHGPDDSDFGTGVRIIGDLMVVTSYEDVGPLGFQSGTAHLFTRGGSTWTEQLQLLMAPGVDGIPGPAQNKQRFGNFIAMTKAGSQTLFVLASQTYSTADAAQVGAVYTATLK